MSVTLMTIPKMYTACGYPRGTSEVEAWNALDNATESDSTLVLKVGLFGYDISCLVSLCAGVNNTDGGIPSSAMWGYCALIEARGLDGLAFGIYAKIPEPGAGWYYCAGFRNDEPGNRTGNTWVCLYDDSEVYTYLAFNDYQVSETFYDNWLNGSGDLTYHKYENNAKGLGAIVFGYLQQASYNDDFTLNQAFRFIGQEENDYQRWSVGETINMFMLDYDNNVYADNPMHVLAGAEQIVLSGAVLLTAAILM